MLTISFSALAANYNTLKSKVADTCTVAGVVKADGYGTGAVEAALTLYKQGCRFFFVAHEAEGVELRNHMPPDIEIGIFNGLGTGDVERFKQYSLIPCLNHLAEVQIWRETGLPCVLHFDTGMSRLGFGDTETGRILADPSLVSSLHVTHIMSHLVSSEDPTNPLNDMQLQRFKKLASAIPDTAKSLANSSGIYLGAPYHFDMVRPGYALYGGNPTPHITNPMQEVVRLEARVLQVKQVKAGATAGYNSTYTFLHDTHVAILNIGYADGVMRLGHSCVNFYWQGVPCHVRGKISMDLTIVDLSNVKSALPQEGDTLELLGPHQSIDTLADIMGTNGYEILTTLGNRYERRYI